MKTENFQYYELKPFDIYNDPMSFADMLSNEYNDAYNDMQESPDSLTIIRSLHNYGLDVSYSCIVVDKNNKKAIVINHSEYTVYSKEDVFQYDVLPVSGANNLYTVHYININNNAVKADFYNKYTPVLTIIRRLYENYTHYENGKNSFAGYLIIIPLIAFTYYARFILNSRNKPNKDIDFTFAMPLIYRIAKSQFGISNYFKFMRSIEDATSRDSVYNATKVMTYLKEISSWVPRYSIPVYSITGNSSVLNRFRDEINKSMYCVFIYDNDIASTIKTESVTDINVTNKVCEFIDSILSSTAYVPCCVFMLHDSDASSELFDMIRKVNIFDIAIDVELDQTPDGDKLVMNVYPDGGNNFDFTFDLNDEFISYHLLNLNPDVKEDFDIANKNGLPTSIEDYKEHPAGNPVPIKVVEPIKNYFVE